MNEPFGTCLFCDDIRFEMFNKLSLMGIYGPELISWTKFPLALPRLGIYTSARFHQSEIISSPKVLVYFPGDADGTPTVSQDVPFHLSPETIPKLDRTEYPDPGEFFGFNHPIILAPAVIKQSGYMRVRVVAGPHRVKAGMMRVREASDEERRAVGLPPSP